MSVEKILKYIIILAGIAIALFLFPFLLNLLAPFVLAFIIAALCQRLVRFLDKKANISRGISSAIIVTSIVAIFTGLIFFLAFQVFSQAKNLISDFPNLIDSINQQFTKISEKFTLYKLSLPDEVVAVFDAIYSQLIIYSQNLSASITNRAFNIAKNFASALPGIILFLTMFLLATFFFTKDYLLIINFFREIFSQKLLKKLSEIKLILVQAFSSYVKAQLILMFLTAFLVTVCFWIVGIGYPLVWGFVCGLVDLLPFLGTAIVLIPLALIALLYNDIYTFVALCIIQIIVFIFRQITEPRIVSKQIGMHPILTLISVYIGLKYFGFWGIVVAPILTLLGINLYVSYKENTLH